MAVVPWLADPLTRRLSSAEIDVWLVNLDVPAGLAAGVSATLAADEAKRAERMRSPEHGRRWAVGRGCLRIILGGYLGASPAKLGFRTEPRGRPVLVPPTDMSFSVAHAEAVALVAVGRGRAVGIDLEPLEAAAQIAEVAEAFLPADRVAAIRAVVPEERDGAWLRLWTNLEASAKLDGRGLADLDPTTAAALLRLDAHRLPFRATATVEATLAYGGLPASVSFLTFDLLARGPLL